MEPTYALTEQDRELLGNAILAGKLQTAMGVAWTVTFAVFSGGLAAGLLTGEMFDDHKLGFSVTGLCFFVLMIVAASWTWRHRRRTMRPMREAIARNQKHVVRGTLTRVETLDWPRNRLRYFIDGEAVEVELLLKIDSRKSYTFNLKLGRFEYPDNVPVELHCIVLGPDITLLLQAQYPDTPQATRTVRPVGASDLAWVRKKIRFVLIVMAGIGCFLTMVIGLGARSSYTPRELAVVLAAIWILTLFFFVSPTQRQARNNAKVVVIEGPVTEIVSAHVRIGRNGMDLQWYRVGGALFCPEGADVRGGPAKLGQQVTFEFMTRDGRGSDGRFMNFRTGALPDVVVS
jgi:hypothetical protein